MAVRSIRIFSGLWIFFLFSFGVISFAQQSSQSAGGVDTVPKTIAFNGCLNDRNTLPLSGVVGVTFALYKNQQGGAPLWVETQNVQLDQAGCYGALLGAARGELPIELFASGESRWVGAKLETPGQEEQPRFLLVSVPYALKAADADTLGGKPASAFVMVQPDGQNDFSRRQSEISKNDSGPIISNLGGTGTANRLAKWVDDSNIGASTVSEVGGLFGIGTSSPTHLLHVFSPNAQVRVESSGAGPGNYAMQSYAAGGTTRFTVGLDGDLSSSKLAIYDAAAGMYPTTWSGGNVGIGTTSPTHLLHLKQPNAQLRIESTGTGAGNYAIASYAAGGATKFTFGIDGDLSSNKMSIYDAAAGVYSTTWSGGNVGIGNTNPTAKLDVTGTVKANTLMFGDSTSMSTAGATLAANTFTGVQMAPGFLADTPTGIPLPNFPGFNTAISANNHANTDVSFGVAGQVNNTSESSSGVVGVSNGSTGVTMGVLGGTNSTTLRAAGVRGAVFIDTGNAAGVFGETDSPDGTGGTFQNFSQTGKALTALVNSGPTEAFTVRGDGQGGNGRVGIGVSTGLAKLTVKGTATFLLTGALSATAGSNTVTGTGTKFLTELGAGDRITAPGTGEIRIVFSIASDTTLTTSSNWTSSASGGFTNQPALLRVDDAGGTTRLVMDGLNQVGIGTVSPDNPLTVIGRATFRNRVVIGPNNQRPSMLTSKAVNFTAITGTVAVNNGSSTVTGTGTSFLNNLGLGDKIFLGAPSSETRTIVAITDATHLTVDSNFTIDASGVTLTPVVGLFRADDLAGNAKFLINDAGNVGIGTLIPSQKLEVVGDIRVGTSGTNGCVQNFSGTAIMGTCSSDARLKKNIQTFSPVLNKLVQLRPVTYNWRSDEHPEYHFGASQASGLIAQEVEKVFPEMVDVDDRGYKMVNYTELPYMMLQAIKELKAENDTLQNRIEQLKNQEESQIRRLEALVEELKEQTARK